MGIADRIVITEATVVSLHTSDYWLSVHLELLKQQCYPITTTPFHRVVEINKSN